MRSASAYLIVSTLLLCSSLARGQALPGEERPAFAAAPSAEVGLPFFYEHYPYEAYWRHQQNWAVLQDARGLIYVANYDGILEFDGVSWRFIETTSNTVVRSFAQDAAGRIYAGAQGDFGYLAPDSVGTLRYVSLLDKVPVEHRAFTDVWSTHVIGGDVYFQSLERLFRWDGRQMRVWKSEQGFHTSFAVRGQLYVREWGVGLLQLVDDGLQLLPGGERFAEERGIYMMAALGEDQMLVAAREAGFFIYDGTSFTPFPTEVDAYLQEHRLYHGVGLPGGLYALGLMDGGGIVIIDGQGRLVQLLNEPGGILNDWVNHLHVDAQGGLWIALNDQGVVRVDIPSPLSLYNSDRMLDGYVSDMVRYRGQLYVGTSKGLYMLEEMPPTTPLDHQRAVFKEILRETAWFFFPADSVLFVGTEEGLYIVRDETLEKLESEGSTAVYTLHEAEPAKPRIFLGEENGLGLLEHTPEGWKIRHRIAPIDKGVRWMQDAADSTLWVATADNQVLRVTFAPGLASPTIEEFTDRHGLPNSDIGLASINEEIVVLSLEGLFRYEKDPEDPATLRFYRDSEWLPGISTSADTLLSFTRDDEGTYWMAYPDRIEILQPGPEGAYIRDVPAALRFPKANIVHIYVEEDGIVWIANGDDVIRYDDRVDKNYETSYAALVRKVTSLRTGQVLFGGARSQGEAAASLVTFDDIHDDLRFEFAAPSYNDVDENQYQYSLEGRDGAWSAWTYRKSIIYSDLSGGQYHLRVRARNALGIVSEEATFAFRVLPPWYRTWWAYGAYALLLVIAAAMAGRYRVIVQENKQAQEQARELARERVVNERLQQANARLQEANESLVQVNNLKDEFLATTSHELRTPLTAILGFAAVLKEEMPGHFRELIDPIESNGQRLLRTVNSLLELAKLRSGMMEVQREILDVSDVAAEVNQLLAPLARRKALLLELIAPPEPLFVNLDRRFIERILNNLVGNAIKFTEVGRVTVQVKEHANRVLIQVTDTGIGIDENFVPYLFEEFKQESSGLARSHEGSGLGLTITARLVELMEGTIMVDSKKGLGSVFTVSFPRYRPPLQKSVPAHPQTVMVR